eukprot:scaffold90577_cov27-Tisochrysis_lutea.AAC.4
MWEQAGGPDWQPGRQEGEGGRTGWDQQRQGGKEDKEGEGGWHDSTLHRTERTCSAPAHTELARYPHAASQEKKKEEPLPEIPPMPMTVDAAYEFLGIAAEDRGSLEKLKMRFRKMSLKWHPDKNIRRPEAAAEVFKAVNAAYHTLTTNNFDYKRWAESFVIPPMQSLEDVLMMAFKGADPYQIELLLKRRGDYRPHQDFGINLSIPWNAGSKEDPSYHVHTGSAYTTTQGLEDNQRAELGYGGGSSDGYGGQLVRHVETQDLLDQFGEKAQVRGGGHSEECVRSSWKMLGAR